MLWLFLASCPVMSDSLWPHGLQHARSLCPHCLLKFAQVHVHGISDTIHTLFFFCPQSFPASGTFPMSQLFPSDNQNTGVSASASVLPVNIQGWFPLRLTCCPGGSQESSPEPQFEDNNSSVLCLLYGPALTTIHDYWKDHSRDYTDLRWQSNVFDFQHTV